MPNTVCTVYSNENTCSDASEEGTKARDEFERGQDRGEHGRDCGGGAGMVRLCGVPCGSRGKREGMCRKREGRAEVWEG